METFDKLLCSFSSNVLDALQNSVHGCVTMALMVRQWTKCTPFLDWQWM